MKLEFSRQIFGKIIQIFNFTTILPVEAEFFYTDGQTDRQTDVKKLKSLFAIFQTRLKTTTSQS